MLKQKNNRWEKLVLSILLLIGFLYRVNGQEVNYSFWTDEGHVAIFSRAIIERGRPVLINGYSTGIYQWLEYWTSAVSAKLFGLSEFSLRLPTAIFGVLTILVVYKLGKELFVAEVGLLTAFLTTFLNIEILYSRQLRPYQAIQFFWILGAYLLVKTFKNIGGIKNVLWLVLCGILATLFHFMGVMFLINLFVLFPILQYKKLTKKKLFLLFITVLIPFILLYIVIKPSFSNVGEFNNSYYYRVFLTHNYLPIFLLALFGLFFLIREKKYQEFILFTVFLGIQIIFISTFLRQPFVRYLYPVFPFIILLASYGIVGVESRILDVWKRKDNNKINLTNEKNIQILISCVLTLIIILFLSKSNKLSLFPQKVYSLNEDMQEIPEIDWKNIYGFVKQYLSEDSSTILVTNWNDLPVWYLGEGYPQYLVRLEEWNVDPLSSAKIIKSLEGFKKMVKENSKGIFVIDSWDNFVPDGVREYSQDNLKKELEVDRLYPTQPRYWPVTVYSWGI
ncbi:MAG: Dolichyl-phosphate-mannose-protein mannosyltransferase [Microgenomates group bacterium ADurb.Bin219]|nr:MAG: Dolichyl-phosphate-mannose-protein mannosyltransferase [Microgenomates group bacterium ADurb.Bin219]